MTSQGSRAALRSDPLRFLEREFQDGRDAVRLPNGAVCVADPATAREILANVGARYEEHSDFFRTARSTFGPRAAQVEIGRGARLLLRRYAEARAAALPDLVDRRLAGTTHWPDAANRLLYEHLGGALLAPGGPAALRTAVDDVVTRAVLAGARERHSVLARRVLRHRVMRELTAAVRARRTRLGDEPADLLDVVVGAAPPGAPALDLAEVFLSFVFALVGSVGFALGWSVFLLGTHPGASAPPSSVLRESMRLWPVAWMFTRRPARSHELGGILVTPHDQVTVCAYLVQRHPGHWSDPGAFRPERWAGSPAQRAFVAFGWGPHACTGAGVTAALVEDLLHVMTDGYRSEILAHGPRPQVGPALAPPAFTLRLTPRHRHRGLERG